jgi:hypothetical protein
VAPHQEGQRTFQKFLGDLSRIKLSSKVADLLHEFELTAIPNFDPAVLAGVQDAAQPRLTARRS